jgi:hypothetical protein
MTMSMFAEPPKLTDELSGSRYSSVVAGASVAAMNTKSRINNEAKLIVFLLVITNLL